MILLYNKIFIKVIMFYAIIVVVTTFFKGNSSHEVNINYYSYNTNNILAKIRDVNKTRTYLQSIKSAPFKIRIADESGF